MHDPRSLETFFQQYMPAMKALIENMWSSRKELDEYLQFCLDQAERNSQTGFCKYSTTLLRNLRPLDPSCRR